MLPTLSCDARLTSCVTAANVLNETVPPAENYRSRTVGAADVMYMYNVPLAILYLSRLYETQKGQ